MDNILGAVGTKLQLCEFKCFTECMGGFMNCIFYKWHNMK